MTATAPDEQDSDLLLRVQDLQGRLDSEGEPRTRDLAEELLAAVVQLYGDGLERIVATLMEDGEGRRLASTLAEDELIASLLLIHDVHPVPLLERVTEALEQVRPYMESHGGNVELLSLEDGVARISLQGSCSDCAASAVTLELAIKQALESTAPDLERLEVEGVGPPPAGATLPLAGDASAANGFELPVVMSETATQPSRSWFEADHLDLVPVGHMVAATVGGSELVVANVDGALLAYANSCAGCGGRLDGGELTAGTLVCPGCARTFFLPRAGRSMDGERLQLEPFPLLREQGRVKVALGA